MHNCMHTNSHIVDEDEKQGAGSGNDFLKKRQSKKPTSERRVRNFIRIVISRAELLGRPAKNRDRNNF